MTGGPGMNKAPLGRATVAKWLAVPLEERLLARTDRSDPSGCWIWHGSFAGEGYGHLSVRDRHVYAHRLAYELAHGPIPAGLVIDHLCRVRACVNPAHLEAVTNAENTRRGVRTAPPTRRSNCRRGHPYPLGGDPTARQRCPICERAWRRSRSRAAA